MPAFLAGVTTLGYALPAAPGLEDFLVNRLFTIMMALLLLPVLFARHLPGLAEAWRIVGRRGAPGRLAGACPRGV